MLTLGGAVGIPGHMPFGVSKETWRLSCKSAFPSAAAAKNVQEHLFLKDVYVTHSSNTVQTKEVILRN